MKFTITKHIKRGIALSFILGMGATSFAGNTIGDVPASATELRPIERQTTPYDGSCDIEQDLAFYEESPVYLRVGQPKSTVNYVFDKTETYVIVYNQSLFQGNLKFPYVANFVPSTSFEADSSNILTVEATGAIFAADTSIERDEIAGQIITKNNERAALQNANGASLNYYYKLANSTFTPKNGTIKINIHPQITPKTSCTNYYIARCGDGIVDDEDTEGIEVDGDVIEWHSWSLEPDEVCDDGELNGTPGHCKLDCSGTEGTTPGTAACTITTTPSSIEAGQTVTINASYGSGESATITPSLSGFAPFTSPTWSSSTTDTPSTTTTYTMNVQGISGVNDNTCSATVNVTQPEPHLECTLNLSPSVAGTGQVVNVGWNVSNGNFFGTYIYVTPTLGGAWPHRVNANQYNGVSSVMATQTGIYTFTMMVNNNEESAVCTGVLTVLDDVPPCTLTTSTPVINLGETAILNGGYSNGVLANMTPFITGLNFTYPTRSNTNIQVIPSETTTYIMNVQGVLGGSGVSCSTTVHVRNTGLELSKQVVTNVQYQEGDLVTFKVNFGNNSHMHMHNVEVSDYLPQSLDYVSSQIFGVTPPYNFATGTIPGAHQFVTYSGFSLAPGQQGYMLVVGRYKGNAYANYTINNAFAQADDTNPVYAAALFQTYIPSSHITITKNANKLSYLPGEAAQFTIGLTNNGPDAITSLTITDTRPTSPCVTLDSSRTSNMPLTVASANNPYTRTFNGNLAVGQTLYLYLTGNISNDQSCVNTYINNASFMYTIAEKTYTGSTQTSFQVSTTPSSTMMFEKRLVSYGNNPGDPVVFEILYRNNGSATVSNYDIIDYRPGTLNFVSASPMPATQTPVAGGIELHRLFNSTLAPNGSGKIIINGTIK